MVGLFSGREGVRVGKGVKELPELECLDWSILIGYLNCGAPELDILWFDLS